jgi:serine/threonine protein kinase
MEPPISSGTILQNRYHVISVLGQGGFGRTYLAEDQGRFNERCALKELILPEAGNYALEKSKELFQREAESLYKLNHPQVPQFRANFEQDGRLFLVQDYVEGKTYRELLNDRKAQTYIQGNNPNAPNQAPSPGVFSEAEVRQLIVQLLPVLEHIHSKNIIHRDITPDNIIQRNSDGWPVLIDFGVVKELATRIFTSVASAAPVTTVGKVGYAPSEQIQTGRAYPSSDLYSLAATAVVLLTGKEPQSLFDDNQLTWNWRRWTNVSDEFASILNRMLSYRPGDRYQSATEVLQTLQAPAGTPQAPVAPPPPPQQPDPNLSQVATMAVGRPPEPVGAGTRSSRRGDPAIPDPVGNTIWDNPVAVVAIGVGLAALAGLGTWYLVSSFSNKQEPLASVSPSDNLNATPLPSPLETLTPTPTATLAPLPIPTRTVTPTPTTTTSSPTPAPTKPTSYSQRLSLAPGQTVTQAGDLKANTTINYLFQGQQDQRLKATLRGEGVLMTILGPDGKPISKANQVQQWSGTLPFTGNYAIQVSPVKGRSQGDYKLALALEESPKPSPTTTPAPEYNEQRINLSSREPLPLDGQTSPEKVKRYVVKLDKGQELKVQVSNGSPVSINIRNPKGELLPDGINVRSWQAQVPTSGDYKIDVISKNPTKFVINVSLPGSGSNPSPTTTP